MKSIFKISLTVMVVSIFTACKKDKEDPTITIVEPADHEEFHWGDEVHVVVNFTDDRDLKSYHIFMGDEVGNAATDFVFDHATDISGKSYDFHEHVIVPDSVGVVYYLHFEVTDAEGKTTTQKLMLHFAA